MLREPMKRYVSEYNQIRRRGDWAEQFILCEKEVLIVRSTCFGHIQNFSELTLEEFVYCQNQWSNNRMTRHLADMSIIECDKSLSTEQKNHIMLESAKINLQLGLKVFGITEYVPETIYLFEKVLGISFSNKELLKNKESKSEDRIKCLDQDMLIKIAQNNQLDVKLYDFALELFRERLTKFGYNQGMVL
ncbi:unnamed protein product [Gordionus sp. m RMFG-2023]|uniref:heparan-sulfate 6-O-sulfotransferase 1-like n=1 Tax=Gordionus sp. m RMFG-2023 TaxID=3053472 RepID=UPI0030E039CE